MGLVKLILFNILFFATSRVFAQQVMCSAIIDPRYNGVVSIYDKPGGEIVDSIKNDTANENYISLAIMENKGSYFFVSIELPLTSVRKNGWIKKDDYIGAYLRHEAFPMDVVLYKSSKASAAHKTTIRNWAPGLVTIEKCKGEFTYVLIRHKGFAYRGWIKTTELCANAYSSCS